MKFLAVFLFWNFYVLCIDESMADNEPSSPPSLRSSLLLSPPPSSSNLSPPPPYHYKQNAAPLRPSIAVIVAVLTTMFSITFLLLLYAKHCKRENGTFNPNTQPSSSTRKNSGIDRSVIESLPIFRFAALRGHKEGLECSVCLNRFESNEVLRLLPKCKHAFHVECVDTWLDAHSTCPLCRYRVDPEDVLLVEEIKFGKEEREKENHRKSVEEAIRLSTEFQSDEFTRRISGRHSSAGERTSSFLQILVQRPGELTQGVHLIRKSVDSAISRKRSEAVSVGCLNRGGVRKDGSLLLSGADRENFLRRYDHRIILSTQSGDHKKWSDLRPSDLLFLQSEMIIANSGRYSLSSSLQKKKNKIKEEDEEDGRNVIMTRCMSEITGLNRFSNKTDPETLGEIGERI